MTSSILPLTREEAVRRDLILRAYVLGRDWDLDAEKTLVRELVLGSSKVLPQVPLLVGMEWDAAGEGLGDLLFFDGDRRAAVVEVKSLRGKRRNPGRQDVEKQARRFAGVLARVHPDVEIVPLVYTTDESEAGRPPRDPEDRERWR